MAIRGKALTDIHMMRYANINRRQYNHVVHMKQIINSIIR